MNSDISAVRSNSHRVCYAQSLVFIVGLPSSSRCGFAFVIYVLVVRRYELKQHNVCHGDGCREQIETA